MPSFEDPESQLVALVSLAYEPIPAEVAAEVLGLSVQETLLRGENDAVSTPVVLDGVVYAASFDGTIRAVAEESSEDQG